MGKVVDIVELWENIVLGYETENKCGFCWKFYAPLTEKRLNLVRDVIELQMSSDENNAPCCIHVFLVRNQPDDFGVTPSFHANGFLQNKIEYENYTVLFLIKSKEGINNYNEIKGHDVAESRHREIFQPLRNCINFDLFDHICTFGQIANFRGQYVYDYEDEQYYGIRLSIQQRTRW